MKNLMKNVLFALGVLLVISVIIVLIALYDVNKSSKPKVQKPEPEITFPKEENTYLQEDLDNELEVQERFRRQSSDVKHCVQTLDNSVYRNESLEWKLNNCKAEK